MIQYFDDLDLACIDDYSFRRDKKTNYYLSSSKINGKRMRLHVYVWTKAYGKIPKGMQIHHVDKNKFNNNLDNLNMMTIKEHLKYHANNLNEEQKENQRANLIKFAIPKAREWHASKEGRLWHSQHSKENFEKREPIEYFCTQCGTKFYSKRIFKGDNNRFCKNSCKSAFRRDAGYDDITKVCTICGGEFIDNKYRKTHKCKSCRN